METITYFDRLSEAMLSLRMLDLGTLVDMIRRLRVTRGTVWVCGNGGSAANALHWVCDLQKVARVRASVLGGNAALLTAWANDESYAQALLREFDHVAQESDLLICLSCSGVSPNIRALIDRAAQRRIRSVLITGSHDQGLASFVLRVHSTDYAIIEDCHAAIGHALTEELRG